MQWRNTVDRFGIVAQSLHWVIVAGLVASYSSLRRPREDNETGKRDGAAIAAIGIAILALAIAAPASMAPCAIAGRAWPTVMPGYQQHPSPAATHAVF